MDIDYLKHKVSDSRDEHLKIQPGEYITNDVVNILKGMKITVRADCFAKSDPKKPYTLEANCIECGSLMIKVMTKTDALKYLSLTKSERYAMAYEKLIYCNKFICDSCLRKLEEERKKMLDDQDALMKKQKSEDTQSYIEKYLNPNKRFPSNVSWRNRVDTIINMNGVDEDVIKDYIKNMPYQDFLKTAYWTTISTHKKYKVAYKCSICGGKTNLSTHHATYARHGYEHRASVINEDLIVLCQNCHGKFHDKLPT